MAEMDVNRVIIVLSQDGKLSIVIAIITDILSYIRNGPHPVDGDILK